MAARDTLDKDGPSQDDWERHKDKIIELYLGTSLRKVRLEMEKHGFYANECKYKIRFYHWKVRKNLKAADKERILRGAARSDDSGCDGGEVLSPKVARRIKRYQSSKSRSESHPDVPQSANARQMGDDHSIQLAPDEPNAFELDRMGMHEQGHRPTSLEMMVVFDRTNFLAEGDSVVRRPILETAIDTLPNVLQPGLGADSSTSVTIAPSPLETLASGAEHYRELVLNSVSAYYHGRLDSMTEHDQSQDILKFGSSPTSEKFWSNIKNGIYFRKISQRFPDQRSLSNTAFQEAHSLVSEALAVVPLDFLCELLATLSTINTRACPEVRVDFLDHLERQSRYRFGKTHPITVLCHALKHPGGDSMETSRSGLMRIHKIFTERLGGSHQGVYRIMDWLCTLMRRNGELQEARRYGEQAFELATHDHGRDAYTTRAAAIGLSRTETALKNYDRALELCLEVVEGSSTRQTQRARVEADEHADNLSLRAMEDIAEYYVRTRNSRNAIIWLRRAENVSRRLRPEDKDTQHISDKLNELISGNLDGQVADGVTPVLALSGK